jgi:TorA maturation chaperone TorD
MENPETKPVSNTSDKEEADILSDVYAFLALTMRYPTADFLDSDFLNAFESLLDSLDFPEDTRQFSQWRAQCSDLINELQIEYTRLFINSVPRATCPPFASVYVDGDRTLQGKTTEKTKDFYGKCGYKVENEAEPPDHLRFELEFLAALVRENQFEEEDEFLTTLFRPWFKRFKKQCLEEARHPFYRASIQLIDFFTKEEQ